MEQLEDRRLLAGDIWVNTFADVVDDADGLISLREAIDLAAADPGDNAVTLPTGTYHLSLGQLIANDSSGRLTIQSDGPGPATIDAGGTSRRLPGRINQ